jgi:hypothetical protein
MSRKPSMNEIMGQSGDAAKERNLGLSDLHELLGDRSIKLEFSPVGKMRLQAALRKRFGDDYMHIQGVDSIMKEFDKESKFNVTLQKMKLIKGKAKK